MKALCTPVSCCMHTCKVRLQSHDHATGSASQDTPDIWPALSVQHARSDIQQRPRLLQAQAHTCDNTLALPNYWDGVQQPLRSSGLRLSSPRHSRSQSFAMDKHVRQASPPGRAAVG